MKESGIEWRWVEIESFWVCLKINNFCILTFNLKLKDFVCLVFYCAKIAFGPLVGAWFIFAEGMCCLSLKFFLFKRGTEYFTGVNLMFRHSMWKYDFFILLC